MVIHDSFSAARSLLQRLKCFSDTTSADVYEELYNTTVSLFETWLTASDASDEVKIDHDCLERVDMVCMHQKCSSRGND